MPEAPPRVAPRYVFVYGTLRRGGRLDINSQSPAPRYVGLGRVSGALYCIDWYPGLVLGGVDADMVVGEVYAIDAALEDVLDGIEQIESGPHSEYFKREHPVEVDGRVYPCLVYEINPERLLGRERIAHGDWLRFHET